MWRLDLTCLDTTASRRQSERCRNAWTKISRMWPSPTGERVGKRRHDADDVTVQEYMKRLRVSGSGAPSPARAAISHPHPHPGLARAWATAQQQQQQQQATSASPLLPLPMSGGFEPQPVLWGQSAWPVPPPSSREPQQQEQHQQENMLPMSAAAAGAGSSSHAAYNCVPSPPPYARAAQPLHVHPHPPNLSWPELPPPWVEQPWAEQPWTGYAQQPQQPQQPPGYAQQRTGPPLPGSASGSASVDYGSINSLLSQLHAERVRAGARPRWKDDAEEDEEDEDP
jgi:hypothetical protein